MEKPISSFPVAVYNIWRDAYRDWFYFTLKECPWWWQTLEGMCGSSCSYCILPHKVRFVHPCVNHSPFEKLGLGSRSLLPPVLSTCSCFSRMWWMLASTSVSFQYNPGHRARQWCCPEWTSLPASVVLNKTASHRNPRGRLPRWY